MTSFLQVVNRTDVNSAETYVLFCQQKIGTTMIRTKDMPAMKARLRRFFDDTPTADWMTLVRTVDYIRAKRKRLAMPWQVFNFVPWAYKDGLLPELDPANNVPVDARVESGIQFALSRETDPWWISTLTHAEGITGRRTVLTMWEVENGVRA